MFPYQCCEEAEEPDEPKLTPPTIRPLDLPNKALRFVPVLNTFLKTKIEPKLQNNLDVQKQFFDVFKDSVTLIGNVYTKPGIVSGGSAGGGIVVGGVGTVKDEVLDSHLRDIAVKTEMVERMRSKILESTVEIETRKLEAELKNAEIELAKTATNTARYVATNNLDVKTGSDGFKALTTVSLGMGRLRDTDAVKTAKTGVAGAGAAPGVSPELKGMFEKLGRGF